MLFIPIFIVAAVVIVAIVMLAKAAAQRERERIAAVTLWAQANGFSFSKTDPFDLDSRFKGVADIGLGHSRYAFEVLHRNDPVPSYLFRYQFATTETRTVTTTDANGHIHTHMETYEQVHWRNYLIIELGTDFPMLTLRREGWGDKLKGFMGFDDINFESEAFSSRYFVKSSDRQFAYAVIHAQMMEWLLGIDFRGSLNKSLFVGDLSSQKFEPATIQAAWAAAAGFINRIPPFVWQDYGKRAKMEFPALAASSAAMPAATR